MERLRSILYAVGMRLSVWLWIGRPLVVVAFAAVYCGCTPLQQRLILFAAAVLTGGRYVWARMPEQKSR